MGTMPTTSALPRTRPDDVPERLLVLGPYRREADVSGGAACGGDGKGLCVAGAGSRGSDDDEAVPLPPSARWAAL